MKFAEYLAGLTAHYDRLFQFTRTHSRGFSAWEIERARKRGRKLRMKQRG